VPAHATFPGENGRISFQFIPDIYTMNSDGSDVRQLTNFGDSAVGAWQSWSPDGRQLVFTKFTAPDFLGELLIMDADGGNQRLLFKEDGFDLEAPDFSPDGKYIAFTRCQPSPDDLFCGIHRINADGTNLVTLTPIQIGILDSEPEYSRDGGMIAFSSF